MSVIPEVQCGWCKQPAADPSEWMRFRNRALPLCSACALSIRRVLKAGNLVARELGRKLREK